MKKFTLSIIIILAVKLIYAQAFMSENLMQILNADNKKISVLLILKNQVNLDSLHYVFNKNNVAIQKRQKTLIKLLMSKAEKTQKKIISIINNQKDASFTSFWILNAIELTADKEFIKKISLINDIDYIKLNEKKYKEPETKVEKYNEKKMQDGAEPGVIAINSRKMWALGYTGRNRIGMGIDTGVMYKHPAISKNFLGNYLPLSQCWFGYNYPTPFDISSHTHGTHTMGTIMGLVESTHDTIGIAFNAKWIAADPIVSNLNEVRPLSDIMKSFQWALNPDGDTSTVNDIPDAINNSWGYIDPIDVSQCTSPESLILDALEVAGCGVIFSAGNDGPSPGTVSEPAMIAKSLVNTFTVGAVDGNIPAYTIADFSSRGPTICDTAFSLAIKPEVVAPGVNVRSCYGTDGFEYLSGTSMSGPHVVGAFLLLKEAFPYLTGEEIKLALYNTAHDLGDVGEDNTYGKGIIDVYDAFLYLSATHTPVPPKTDYDIAINKIINLNNSYCDTIISEQIIISNNGDSLINGFILNYNVNGQQNSQTFTNIILSGETDTILVNNLVINSGYNTINFKIQIDSAEFDTYNNNKFQEIKRFKTFSLPYFEGFENCNTRLSNSNWIVENPDFDVPWSADSTKGLDSSNISATMKFYHYNPFSGQKDNLISPLIIVPDTGELTLKFSLSYQQKAVYTRDTLQIFVSTDCGQTYNYKVYEKSKTDLQTAGHNSSVEFVPDTLSQWRTETVDLSQFAGSQKINLKFVTTNNFGNDLYLDNVRIFAGLDPQEIKKNYYVKINLFPNPANKNVNIKINRNYISDFNITLTDINGKVLIKKYYQKQENKNIVLNLESLKKGIYIVRYLDKLKTKTFKLSKIN